MKESEDNAEQLEDDTEHGLNFTLRGGDEH